MAEHPLIRHVVPPLATVVAVALFVSLGFWQLDRAAEKEALRELFEGESGFAPLGGIDEPAEFQQIETRGRFLPDRQVLIDNIVRNSTLGYFVITPFELSRNEPLMLVNRGWIARESDEALADLLAVDDGRGRVRGRAGHLPRVGIRPGEAFAGGDDGWPRVAVYPTAAEIADVLNRDLKPFVLLLDPEDPRGFERNWQPVESGPMTHYGYAFQWFAMAGAVLVVAGWHLRKRRATA